MPEGTQVSCAPKWGAPGKEGELATQGSRKVKLRDVGTQVSWGPRWGLLGNGGTPQTAETPAMGEAQEGQDHVRTTVGQSHAAEVRRGKQGPSGCGVPPGSGGLEGLDHPEPGPGGLGSRQASGQEKRASWCGGACESCLAVVAKGSAPKEVGTQLSCREAWELGAGVPAVVRGRGDEEFEVPARGVSRSCSGGILEHVGPKRDPVRGAAVWVQKEWYRDPVEASGQVWVPRKPARASNRTGLPWLQGGACPPSKQGEWKPKSGGVGCSPERNQVWIPREKPAPVGGGPGDVWVHKVRDPSGAGIMWVWAKVTNCNEEDEVEETRVWTFRKKGPRKGGQGEGGYGVF
ncbi:collagen alpha-1(I) chain [Rhineura floridana]|uniref:collagen alpha-1(I) chain n=1 Tax=Rhineura floridana TaxID=261503 RepID=UPI002AC84107|nr:collagen alpha-1(I) chain [Rhineura floridana]